MNKVSFKGIEIDTTEARLRINILKDELNQVFLVNHEEFLQQSAEELLKVSDLSWEQVDKMTLTPDEIKVLNESSGNIYMDRLLYLK